MDRKEDWKDIFGYEGLYKVSNRGIVVGYAKKWLSGRWVNRSRPEREMTQSIDHKGYFIIGLRKNGKQKMFKVHRLVAMAFIENPENKPQVNHKDTNKKNNHVDNLEWATSAENMQHAHDNGFMNLPRGENHKRSKVTEYDVLAIRSSNEQTGALSKKYNLSKSQIKSIRSKTYWAHI